ncbi:MAG: hypothetical protein Q8Q31_01385 [Nanoarchaeota archaeon]|nr:hypothetical protein [Nanoarchaeota archaeon]
MAGTEDIIKKYTEKIEKEISSSQASHESKEYLQFKQDMVMEVTRYERWAKSLGSTFKVKLSDKENTKIQRYLDDSHLDVTASQALALSIMSLLIVFAITLIGAFSIFLINGSETVSPELFTFVVLGMLAALFIFYYTYTMPQRLANSWKMKASSQMVPAILYVVIYMKHTSNLERAIEFAAQHLEGPLALDLKKIFYDVEISKFSTIKQSLDNYLEGWNDYAPEFVESFHLIESSLYEPSENRRVQILEKGLQVILDGIYEKMLKYSREIRSPLTNVYMLGIILPTLGLAIIPLASTLLQGAIKWYHVMILFNIIVPFIVFFMTSEIMLKRPGGYGDASILELNPDYPKYKSKKPWLIAGAIALPLFVIGILPFLFQMNFFVDTLGLQKDYTFEEVGISMAPETKLFDFKTLNITSPSNPERVIQKSTLAGPFGPLGTILSLFIPFSIALFFVIAYKKKTYDLIKSRDKTKSLEDEFTNSLFQLGNRLGDGMPPEIAFSKVAESTKGQATNQFFVTINQNIQQMGMSVDNAVFDKKRGAIIYFPSALIATSMRILIESSKKGLQVAARSLMSISDYVKNIQKINQRLKDLLAEVVSDMKSNMTFLAPLLAGIVVGLSSMIIAVISKLETQALQGGELGANNLGSLAGVVKIFASSEMIPPYFLQLAVGTYIIEIIFILTIALVTLDAGKDPLREKYDLSKNLKTGIFLYLLTALFSIVVLTMLAAFAINF